MMRRLWLVAPGLGLMLAACGAPPVPQPPPAMRPAPANVAASPPPAGADVAAPAPRTLGSGSGPQWRCGWFVNPTPGNAWLIDRDGEWLVGAQGGPQATGDWPSFEAAQWVRTNRGYGHGCACLMVRVERTDSRVLEILAARPRPLSACRADRTLPAEPDRDAR